MVKKSFMSAFKSIFIASKGSALNIEDNEVLKSLDFLKRKLGIGDTALIFLSAIIGMDMDEDQIPMNKLADYLGITKMDIYEHGNDFNSLDELGYISNQNFNSVAVMSNALDCLIANKPFHRLDTSNWPAVSVLGELRNCIRMDMNFHSWELRMKGNLFVEKVESYAKEMVKNSDLENLLDNDTVKVVRNIILYCAYVYIYSYTEEDKSIDSDCLCSFLFYRNGALKDLVFDEMLNEKSPFIKGGYFAYPCIDGVVDPGRLFLSHSFAKELGLNEAKGCKQKINSDMLICHTDVVEKALFYDEKTQKDVERLMILLSQEQFCGIQQRLLESNMRTGFTVLLYGAPGTGKTETVLQLAKATGRDIMQVNYEDLKNKFVGESEKMVKQLFRDYAAIVKTNKVAPILLFNEADGILSKRKHNAENAVDKMENTVQNIILQEMEKLDGIMIATTNLTCNFDTAFERRFLYKIKYEKPDKNVRAHIWHSMLESLPECEISKLADDYEFSGGEIENIARKQKVEYILSGKTVSFGQLREFCESEKIEAEGVYHKRVGFCYNKLL